MAKPPKLNTELGKILLDYRKKLRLTQVVLAARYNLSGSGLFKIEKGFLLPSLPLWLKMANDIGIPEKNAILIWVKDRLPARYKKLIRLGRKFKADFFRKKLEALGNGSHEQRRTTVLNDPEISPALKKFISNNQTWENFQPTIKELGFLAELGESYPQISVSQLREAVLIAREIQSDSE